MTHVIRAQQPQPLILIAANETWLLRELSRVLMDAGFRISIAHDERETLAKTDSDSPGGIVLDLGVAPGYDLCRKVRTAAVATPIVLVGPGVVTRDQHRDALIAGAWAIFGTPLDTDDLLLHLSVFMEPRHELQRVSEERLVDGVSGLYNPAGLKLRAAELAAIATRHGLALACAVFRPATPLPNHLTSDRLARAFKSVGRVSDALGRTGRAEFAVFAPATSTGTGGGLVRRMTDSVEREFGNLREGNKRVGVRAGYSAALAQSISPASLLTRARMALDSNA